MAFPAELMTSDFDLESIETILSQRDSGAGKVSFDVVQISSIAFSIFKTVGCWACGLGFELSLKSVSLHGEPHLV